jgi:WG containing repeat
MPHPQCPNIKNDILELRATLGELNKLKIKLLDGNPLDKAKLILLLDNAQNLVENIGLAIDHTANETIRKILIESSKYEEIGGFAEGRARVKIGNKQYAHIDVYGNLAYTTIFRAVSIYNEGLARACDLDGNSFHIDRDGKPIYKAKFRDIEKFCGGSATVTDHKGRTYSIDTNGNMITNYFRLPLN